MKQNPMVVWVPKTEKRNATLFCGRAWFLTYDSYNNDRNEEVWKNKTPQYPNSSEN